jgi:hypothetical protein
VNRGVGFLGYFDDRTDERVHTEAARNDWAR